MKKKITVFLSIFFIGVKLLMLTGCAGIVPPNGGPKDTLPPRLVRALPTDSATNVTGQKIVLTFDEFVELKDAQQNVLISPLPSRIPNIEYSLRTVTVKLRDSLEKNTTYSLNFGNSIKDVNEGNVFRNFTYVFSTGPTIAQGRFEGKVVLAETGKTDSNLLVILHRNLNDTAIYKSNPRYLAKVNGNGEFKFKFIEPGVYNAFVVPDEYSKRYDDSTKVFAFLDSTITIGKTTSPVTFYAYQEEKKKEKPANSSSSNNKNTSKKEDKSLKIATNLESGRIQGLVNKLQLTFSKRLGKFDSSKIILCDTFYNPMPEAKVSLDTSNTIATVSYPWKEGTFFRLIVDKDAAQDTSGNGLKRGDTLKFNTNNESDYGSILIKFSNLDLKKHPVMQVLNNDKIEESVVLTSGVFKRKLYKPGDYIVRILFDNNQNGVWDPGNYKKRLQPEIVLDRNWKVNIKANWDNETEIKL